MNRLLRAWLFALVALPAFAVSCGFERGPDGLRHAFTLYREPKLIAIAILGWTFLALFFWHRRRALAFEGFAGALERPAILALLAFLGWMALTGLWVTVRANYFYELQQYGLLAVLLVVLLVWSRDEARVAATVELGLLTSGVTLTLIGLLQLAVPLPLLSPINPEIGAPHPSLMGYKNPAALAVLGQIFLLGGRAFTARGRRRLGWGILLAAELVYLASLGSRTSYAAFTAAALVLAILVVVRQPRHARRFLPAAGAAVLLFVAVFVVYPPAGERAARLAELARDPSSWLDTDRGTYARNTLHMARHNPLGVGLGDWQTQYPVFRLHNRDLAFSDEFQVRRAHGDHVQTLGEGGFPGLALWAVFLILILGTAVRGRAPSSFFLTAQLTAFFVAMAGDYLLELPYHKFQFFLVVFLALAAGRGEPRPEAPPGTAPPRLGRTIALAFAVLAVVQVTYHLAMAQKVHLAATLERSYLTAVDWLGRDLEMAQVRAAVELERTIEAGRRLDGLPGHVKTLHRTYFVVGHSFLLLERRPEARAATVSGLALYPYSPNGLRLMESLAEDPAKARRWREAYRFVMENATSGWRTPPLNGTLIRPGGTLDE